MPPRGKPFDPSGGKKKLVLHCPWCGAALKPHVVVALGPQQHHVGSTPLTPPYYRYDCEPPCTYGEVQGHLLLVEEDHP